MNEKCFFTSRGCLIVAFNITFQNRNTLLCQQILLIWTIKNQFSGRHLLQQLIQRNLERPDSLRKRKHRQLLTRTLRGSHLSFSVKHQMHANAIKSILYIYMYIWVYILCAYCMYNKYIYILCYVSYRKIRIIYRPLTLSLPWLMLTFKPNQTPIVAPAALASWCVPPVLGATSCTPQVAESSEYGTPNKQTYGEKLWYTIGFWGTPILDNQICLFSRIHCLARWQDICLSWHMFFFCLFCRTAFRPDFADSISWPTAFSI